MANSGSKSLTVTSYDTLKFSWEESSQSIENNTTTISWKMQLVSTSYGAISSSVAKDWKVVVNGKTYSGTNYVSIGNNTTKTLASGTTTISHNSDGTKSFSYSFSQEFAITFSGSYIGTKSGSGTGTLDTIPRKSTLSVSAGTLGTAQTLTISEKASAFTHKLTYSCGSASGYILGDSSATSSTLSTSWTPPISLASQNTTGTSVSVKFTLYTYKGSTQIGSNSYTKSFAIPSSVKPSCSVSVSDPTGYKDKYGSYIKGKSKFKVTVTPTTSQGSAIASYSTTANGATYTSASFTTGELKYYETLTISAKVTDKRGRSGTASTTANVLNYANPSITSLKVKRCNPDGSENLQGEYVQVTFNSKITSLSNKNSAAYKLEYKKSTDSTYTAVTLGDYAGNYAVSGGTYTFAADTGATYNVRVTATDDFGSSSKSTSASTAFTLMHFNKSGKGIGIGKVSEGDRLEIGINTKLFDENGTMYDLLGALRALSTSYTMTCTPTAGTGWSNVSATAYLIGNCLRVGISATRNENPLMGNQTNETVMKIKVDSGGKIQSLYRVSFCNDIEGSVASFSAQAANNDDGTQTITILLTATTPYNSSATTGSATYNGYFVMPADISISAYV